MDRWLYELLLRYPALCAFCRRPLWPGDVVTVLRLTLTSGRAYYCDRERCTQQAAEKAAEKAASEDGH